MWKAKLLSGVFVFAVVFSSVGYSEDISTDECEGFSRRMIVHESINGCLDTVYEIRSGELAQEEGLNQLEVTLDMIQFMCWYWIED